MPERVGKQNASKTRSCRVEKKCCRAVAECGRPRYEVRRGPLSKAPGFMAQVPTSWQTASNCMKVHRYVCAYSIRVGTVHGTEPSVLRCEASPVHRKVRYLPTRHRLDATSARAQYEAPFPQVSEPTENLASSERSNSSSVSVALCTSRGQMLQGASSAGLPGWYCRMVQHVREYSVMRLIALYDFSQARSFQEENRHPPLPAQTPPLPPLPLDPLRPPFHPP